MAPVLVIVTGPEPVTTMPFVPVMVVEVEFSYHGALREIPRSDQSGRGLPTQLLATKFVANLRIDAAQVLAVLGQTQAIPIFGDVFQGLAQGDLAAL
jgi:hypothetical protein